MTTPAPALHFDSRALTERMSRRRARKVLAARGIDTGRLTSPTSEAWLTVGGLVLIVGGILLMMLVPDDGQGTAQIIGLSATIGGAILSGIGLFQSLKGDEQRSARLALFAPANAMRYLPHNDQVSSRRFPGALFSFGSSRNTTDIVRGDSPRVAEFGTFSCEENDNRKYAGYIAVHLDAPLPHIVLNATGSKLPMTFPDARKLSLEGDFGRFFTLMCPPGYEADAYYLFSPDVMARFVDHAARLDVEIVDDWLIFSIDGRRATPTDPAQWAWMFSLVAAMLDKVAAWSRWRDDRLLQAASSGAPAGDPSYGMYLCSSRSSWGRSATSRWTRASPSSSSRRARWATSPGT